MAKMIPRKKIQALIGTFSIFYFIGNVGQALAYQTQSATDDHSKTDPLIHNNLISDDNYKSAITTTGSYSKSATTVARYLTSGRDAAEISENISPDVHGSTVTFRSYSELPTTIDQLTSTKEVAKVSEGNSPATYGSTTNPTLYSKLYTSDDHLTSTEEAVKVSEGNSQATYGLTTTPELYSKLYASDHHWTSTEEAVTVSKGSSSATYGSTTTFESYPGLPTAVYRLLKTHDATIISVSDSPTVYESQSTADASSRSATSDTPSTEDSEIVSEDELNNTTTSTSSSVITTTSSSCSDIPSSVQNLTVSSMSNSLHLTWQSVESDEECILTYSVTWYSNSDNSGFGSANTTELEFTISDLTSCTYFTISVTAVGIYASSDAQFVSGNTTESQISNVENLTVSNFEDGVNVTWVAPNDTSCLEHYLIDVATESNVTGFPKTISTALTYQEFDDIPSCTAYTVSVTPISIGGISGLPNTANGETLASIPGAVRDLTASTITAESVYLTWSEPTVNVSCILHYEVYICLENNCTSEATISDTFYNATDLSPCLDYTFIVSAVGLAGSSDPISTTAETSFVSPGAPDSVLITGGDFSLEISWNAPLSGGTCTASYRVTLWYTTVTTTTTDTNVTIHDLSACTNYTVQINSVSTASGDGGFIMTTGITGSSVTAPPVLETDESQVTRNTISIGVRINETSNNCELQTLLTICNFTSTNGSGISVKNGVSRTDISGFNATSDIINVTVESLSPFSLYECYSVTENIAGFSEPSISIFLTTSEDVPSAPTISVSNLTNSWFTLVWEKPEYLAGVLIEHEIYLSWERQFLMPSSCEENNSTEATISEIAGKVQTYFFSNATAYSKYTAKIRARTSAGWGNYSSDFTFETNASLPGIISYMEYLNKSNPMDANVLDTFLFWRLPCALNGKIESFLIYFHGSRNRSGFNNHTHSEQYIVTNITDADYKFEINLQELRAEYHYTFEISAKVVGIPGYGDSYSHNVIYPAGIPPWPEDDYMDALRVDPFKAERSSTTATILLPLFDDTNGDIQYYAIMIAQCGYSTIEQSRFDIRSGNWPNVSSWSEAISQNPIVNYQATAIRWQPAMTGNIGTFGSLSAVQYMLGEDTSCTKSSSSSFCNGPLEPDTFYQVRMRAFTNGGYRDSLAVIAKTKAEFNLGLVIGVVFGLLFCGIVLTMTFLIRKGVLQTIRSNFLNRNVHNVPVLQPMTRKKFRLHCQELIEHPGKLSNEFQLLQTLSVDLEMSAHAAVLQANRKKNRYINILPYDISRVKLEVLNNDPNTDYINASFMPGYSGISEYIACQGPKEETTYDFWRMVIQYNIKVIVMVTQLVEKGRDKCHQYYPNVRENFEYEDITIRCSTQLDFQSHTQRLITLQNGKIQKRVTHLHFKEWSDHGVPDDVHSMIDFCQIVRKEMIDKKSLAVIHCSAGVGRTGTLIAIDILLQQIKDNKKLDVFGTVYKLRQHRMSMVQTENQYAYIYNCTLEALNNPYPPKLYKPPSGDPIYENLRKKKREITDSNTNLVNSAETLKKLSPSPSTKSMEPICEIVVPERPIYSTQLSTLSQGGLRYSKSTSAIHTQLQPSLQLVRYGSHEYPIFEPAPDSPSSRRSRDHNSLLEFVRPIRIETRVARPKSLVLSNNTDYYKTLN